MDRNERLKRARECYQYVIYKYCGVDAIGYVDGYSKLPNCERVTSLEGTTDVHRDNISKITYERSIFSRLTDRPKFRSNYLRGTKKHK